MDTEYAARQAHLRGGVARSFDELQQAGLDFWQAAPPGARLEAIWKAILDAWVIGGKRGPPPRFDRAAFGVLPFER